jgi:hypothetical protein
LKTKKYIDFLLFKKAYNIISNKEHLTYLQKLVNIRASLNKGLSEKQLLFLIPFQRQNLYLIKNKIIIYLTLNID